MPQTNEFILALLSGLLGALAAQAVAIWNAKKLEAQRAEGARQIEAERAQLLRVIEAERRAFTIQQTKLDVLRKIAGNRSAITDNPIQEQRAAFFEGLNQIMCLFADSKEVSNALVTYKSSIQSKNHHDCFVTLFKTICANVGVDTKYFNDSLLLEPFSPKSDNNAR